MKGAYQKAYDESIKDPSSFWDRAAQEIHWYKKYSKVLDDSKKPSPAMVTTELWRYSSRSRQAR